MTVVAHISDCHLFADNKRLGYADVNPYQSLRQVLAQIQRRKPDWICITGDISADGSEQSYRHFLTLLTRYKLQHLVSVLPGNHDPSPQFESSVGTLNLIQAPEVKLDNWRLLGLDTRHKGTQGFVSRSSLAHLQQLVGERPDQNVLLGCHHHPVSSNSWMDSHDWVNRHEFIDILSQLPQIKLVMHGHLHAVVHHHLATCQLISCPSTCWQWKMDNEFALDPQPAGFNLYKLTANGAISIETVRTT